MTSTDADYSSVTPIETRLRKMGKRCRNNILVISAAEHYASKVTFNTFL